MPRILIFIIHGKTTGVDQRELGSSVLGSDFVSKCWGVILFQRSKSDFVSKIMVNASYPSVNN